MTDENILYWIWLSEKCGIASKEFGKLVEQYENPFDLYRMDDGEIEHLSGIGRMLKDRLCEKSLEHSYTVLRYCKQHKVAILPYSDPRYPSRLRNIEDPPVLLYAMGKLPDWNDRLCIGMVGTRKMSEYGRQTAYKISYELASARTIVVSGMALGVDGVSACGALAAGGCTVAVLGCGISVAYPKQHEHLMHEIARQGVVITEYAPTEPPHGYHFPKRNRIISGICQGVLVVEGAPGSGALITARLAVDQGRELFALPGKVNESNSDGPNELIQSGAYVALCAEDILRYYDFLYHDMIHYKGLQTAKRRWVPEETALKRYGVCTADPSPKATAAESVPAEEPVASAKAHRRPTHAQKPSGTQGTQPSSQPETTDQRSADGGDHTATVLASLDSVTRRVFERMPADRAVSPDLLMEETLGIGEIITALTLLELSGLIDSLPGGLYMKR